MTPRPLFSCIAENDGAWTEKVASLILSLRTFGGSVADAPFVVNVVGDVSSTFAARVAELGAETRIVTRSAEGVPPTIKVEMLELVDEYDFDVLVALDCDVIVTGDIAPFLSSSTVRAALEGRDTTFSGDDWDSIYEAMRVDPGPRDRVLSSSGALSYPYYNTGVVMVPATMCRQLARSWREHIRSFERWCEHDDKPFRVRWWADQVGFAAAIASGDIALERLPVALNVHSNLRVHRSYLNELKAPFVIHYHQQYDDKGFLLACREARLDPYIDSFNLARAEHLGLGYPGLQRPSLARRAQTAARDNDWYQSRALRRMRFSRPGRALKRIFVG
jgi:hypothetical protein